MGLANYKILTVVSEAFSQNAYVLWRIGSDQALVIDPGLDLAKLVRSLRENNLVPAVILNTHGHYDHIAGNAPLKQAYPDVPLWIGRNEVHLLTDPDANLSGKLGLPMTSPEADRLLDEGERVQVAGFSFLVREIPGHSPGSIVFIAEGEDPPFVLAGDVLFAGSVGRADFPGGNAATLLDGIRNKLLNLPDDTRVYAGHGPATTIGTERRSNPFVGQGLE